MEFNIFFLITLIAMSINGIDPSGAHIINNTNQPLRADFEVPKYCRADVEITKLQSLQKAILDDSPEDIRKAVRAGVSINITESGKSSLLVAILHSRYNAIEILLRLGAVPDNSCVEYAMKMKDTRSLLSLAKSGCLKCNLKDVIQIISLAIIQKRDQLAIDLILELIKQGYDINEFWSPIIIWAYYGSPESEDMVRFVLSRGANPNHVSKADGTTPLLYAAAEWPNKQIVKTLIEFGANVNQEIKAYRKQQTTLLSYTIARQGSSDPKRKEVIGLLLEKGANLEA